MSSRCLCIATRIRSLRYKLKALQQHAVGLVKVDASAIGSTQSELWKNNTASLVPVMAYVLCGFNEYCKNARVAREEETFINCTTKSERGERSSNLPQRSYTS